MIFDFDNQLTPQNTIDINDLGNCCMECSNDDGFYYYLILSTRFGTTTTITFGPVIPDIEEIPDGYTVSMNKQEFKQDKIAKNIKYFLNDKKKITTAREISIEEALNNLKDIKEYMTQNE